MPISGGNSSSLSEELIAQLESLNVTGGLGFKYTDEALVNLQPNTKTLLLPSTTEEINRQAFLFHHDPTAKVYLFWGDNESQFLAVYPNGQWIDSNDGGIALYAVCDRNIDLSVVVRQTSPINYAIGDDGMPEPDLKMRGIAPGLTNWGFPLTLFGLMNYEAELNLRKVFDPETATSGHKMWAFDVFAPGKTYTFNIAPSGSDVGTDKFIQIYQLKLEIVEAAKQAFQSMEIYNSAGEIPRDLIDFVKTQSWIAKVAGAGGEFSISPTQSRFVLFFGADNLNSGFTDVGFTTYTENSNDPKQGGSFQIVGF